MKTMIALVLLCSATPALAQTTYVNPTYNGGYVATTPGAPPTYYNRLGNGYVVTQPGSGAPPAYINPSYNGGYTITQPGASNAYPLANPYR